MTRVRLVHVFTVPESLVFLRGQLPFLRDRGIDASVICSGGAGLTEFGAREGVPVHAVDMARRITPLEDLRSVGKMVRLLREIRPDIVHAHTPKGGLLGMLSASLAGVPGRIYHLRGLPMLTETGARRALLRTTERISCTLSDRVLCVSHSLREAAIREGLVTPERIRVLAGGSGNGVDARGRFDPARSPPAARRAFRRELGIEEDAPVVGFVGRLVRDKGIVELVDAWRRVVACHPAARLVVVGDFEERDAVPDAIRRALLEDPTIRTVGFRPDIERCYSAFDVVVLPTHREGFPNVLLEAGAMALPVVATRIPGCVDAVVPGVTGTLVPPGEGVALAEALERYLSDRGLAVQHGQAARRRILEEFEPPRIWAALADVYAELLREAGRETPARPEEDRSREGSG